MADNPKPEKPEVPFGTPQPITSGALLLQKLRESGTPDHHDGPLTAGRRCLTDAWAEDKRVAAAREVADALEHGIWIGDRCVIFGLGTDHGTVRKARQLIATGEVAPCREQEKSIEDILAPDTIPKPLPTAEELKKAEEARKSAPVVSVERVGPNAMDATASNPDKAAVDAGLVARMLALETANAEALNREKSAKAEAAKKSVAPPKAAAKPEAIPVG